MSDTFTDRLALLTPSEVDGVASSSRNEGFKLPDHLLNSISEMHERWNNRLELERTDLSKAYFEGRIGVLVNFERLPLPLSGNVRAEIGKVDVEIDSTLGLWQVNEHRRNGNMQEHVFIFHVQVMQGVNKMPFSVFEEFKSFEEIRQIASGCFYSATNSFVSSPVICDRQFGVSVLCSTVEPSKFPVRVIESGSQVMDYVRNDEREVDGRLFAEVDISCNLPAFRIFGNSHSVRVVLDKQSQKFFKISDVMLGPLNL